MIQGSAPRILICRLSAVGDCVLTLPVLCALRSAFPDATLGWLVEPLSSQLLQGHEALDELIIAPRGWLKSPSTIANVRRELRSRRFDVAIDAQSLTKSGLAGWLSGARQRVGFRAPQGRELAPWLNNRLVRKNCSHVVDAQLELLGPLGVENPTARFNLPEYPAARGAIGPLVQNDALRSGFAVLNPGAGWDSKLWPAERFAEVARQLGERRQLPSLVVWAGDRERQWAEQIVRTANGYAVLAPPTSLTELVEVLRNARLFVGSDTGPMHMAAAVGTPCVAIFGPTLPEVCGPYGPGHRTLQAYHQSGSSRERRGTNNHAMRAVSVAEVIEACGALLAEPKQANPHSGGTPRRDEPHQSPSPSLRSSRSLPTETSSRCDTPPGSAASSPEP